jgi:hypothetical protein
LQISRLYDKLYTAIGYLFWCKLAFHDVFSVKLDQTEYTVTEKWLFPEHNNDKKLLTNIHRLPCSAESHKDAYKSYTYKIPISILTLE